LITAATMVDKTMASDNESLDDSTPLLLSQGTILSGTPEEQPIRVPPEETANSENELASSLQETATREPDPNQPRWSWTGLPERLKWIDQALRSRTGLPAWLGLIAILALLLGYDTNVTATLPGSCTDTRCSILTVSMESSFMLTAYLKIGKTCVGSTDEAEDTHYHQVRGLATNNMQHGSYKHIRLVSPPRVHW